MPALRERYCTARPFPHIVLDDFIDASTFADAVTEFPNDTDEAWTNYLHVNERKFGNTHLETWGPTLQSVAESLMSPPFLKFLEDLTGIEGLLPDPTMDGGGLHRSVAGGYLNVHADFTTHHTHQDWHRRVNLLLYLNEGWQREWGGNLELWSSDMKTRVESIAPVGNRVVIFNTTEKAYHGHPVPLGTPPGVARKSMALYYFTAGGAPVTRSTDYRARPDDGAKRVLIYLDKKALWAYDTAKRRLGISDDAASRWLARAQNLGRRRRP